jgi:hypothetical protein
MGGTFSLSVHHKDFTTFAAQSGLITLPEQPYRYFTISRSLIVVSSSLQHVKELHGTSEVAKPAKKNFVFRNSENHSYEHLRNQPNLRETFFSPQIHPETAIFSLSPGKTLHLSLSLNYLNAIQYTASQAVDQ